MMAYSTVHVVYDIDAVSSTQVIEYRYFIMSTKHENRKETSAMLYWVVVIGNKKESFMKESCLYLISMK